MTAFYEHFSRERLLSEAKRFKFPLRILRLALHVYEYARYITLHGLIAYCGHAQVGIIAGCGIATSFVQLYSLSAFDDLVSKFPLSVFDIYI